MHEALASHRSHQANAPLGLAWSASEPPCDAHHLKFAQPRTLGRKVSDEFTVPLCRDHHLQLHQHGNEGAWWANLKIAPLEMAQQLWSETLRQEVDLTSRLLAATLRLETFFTDD